MVKSVTMVIYNKILSRGTQLAQTQWCEKEQHKKKQQNNHVNKLKGE